MAVDISWMTPEEQAQFRAAVGQKPKKGGEVVAINGTPIAALPPNGKFEYAPEYSDEALALFFADRHAGNIRYVHMWGRWMIWDGQRWVEDNTLDGMDRVRLICRQMAKAYEASKPKAPSGPKSLASAKTANAVLGLARADRRIAATVDQWDERDWLLNTPGGTIDLRTLESTKHRPTDYLTQITTINPKGDCPLWKEFLKRISDGNQEWVDYIQRVCGYTLTGITVEHAMFFLYGTGQNGKSKFVEVIQGIMGEYHKTAPIETFTMATGDRHPTELARLRGARAVTSVETEQGRRWAESRIKSLTGGDRISARFMRQDFFEYNPKFKLIIAGNHKPGLRSVDEAIRRRFNLIPFAVTIPMEERDQDLGAKLMDEWSGILSWMMDGCAEWQTEGLKPPEIVRSATDAYLAAEDAIAAWLEECCEVAINSFTGSTQLWVSWSAWAETNGESKTRKGSLIEALKNRGFHEGRTAKLRGLNGLRLKSADQFDPI
jgi:putative DNA primase/helicase